MKKLLILGQVPKEYGGNYTTGVSNVIMELGFHLAKEVSVYIYGTNLNTSVQSPVENMHFLGYSKPLLIKLLLQHLIKRPLGILREYRQYRNRFGVPPLKFLAYRILIQEYIRKIKPDYINAHGMIFSPIIKNLNLENVVFFSFHGFMHDDPASVLANSKRGIDMNRLYNEGAKHVRKSIHLTRAMRNKGVNGLNIPDKHTYVVSNGVSTDKFYFDPDERLRLRREKNIDADATVFISVGALTRRKNHLGFIRFLEKNNINAHYLIIGKAVGQEKETLRELQDTIDKAKGIAVEIINYVAHDELFRYYSAADIYAHPSSSEGQALVALEALCCGLPLVVNHQIEETLGLDDSFNEYLHIVDLKKDKMPEVSPPDRELLSSMCREKLSWKASAGKYLNVFQN